MNREVSNREFLATATGEGMYTMTRWIGSSPTTCQVCYEALGRVFYDAALPRYRGSWANLCEHCFATEGCTLGVGRGQRYEQQEDGTFKCVEGGRENAIKRREGCDDHTETR